MSCNTIRNGNIHPIITNNYNSLVTHVSLLKVIILKLKFQYLYSVLVNEKKYISYFISNLIK